MTGKLRVGIVCPYSLAQPGGVQNHVLGVAGWLRSKGHSVAILAPGQPDPEVLQRYGVRAEDFTSAGAAIPVAYNGSVARITFGLGVALRVREWLDDGYFDLLHIHEPMVPSVSLLALQSTTLPVTATFHAASPESWSMEAAYQALHRVAARIDVPIAVSGAASVNARRYAGLRPRIIGNGIRLADHQAPPVTGRWRAGGHPSVCFLGRYDEPRKGFATLLAALPEVLAVHPDLTVQVVGRGTPERHPAITYLGPVDDEARDEVLAHSDAYVAPQTGRESFGIVLLEALASGAPVVASDLPAFVEVLSDAQGPIGDVFRAGDPESLADALLASLSRPRDEQLERGLARAARFDWDVLGPQVVQAYEDAMVAHRRRRRRDGVQGRALARHVRTRHSWGRLLRVGRRSVGSIA